MDGARYRPRFWQESNGIVDAMPDPSDFPLEMQEAFDRQVITCDDVLDSGLRIRYQQSHLFQKMFVDSKFPGGRDMLYLSLADGIVTAQPLFLYGGLPHRGNIALHKRKREILLWIHTTAREHPGLYHLKNLSSIIAEYFTVEFRNHVV